MNEKVKLVAKLIAMALVAGICLPFAARGEWGYVALGGIVIGIGAIRILMLMRKIRHH